MKKRIILIRHGKTKGNLLHKYIGQKSDESLCSEGIEEIKNQKALIRSYFTKEPVIISSPLKRCRETASLLFDKEPDGILDELKEIDFGVFEGKDYKELSGKDYYQKWIDSNGRTPIPMGEDRESFTERSYNGFLKALLYSQGDTHVCIICHGGNIMSVMMKLTGRDYYDFHVKNLEGYVLEINEDNGVIDLISYNCINLGCDT
ncbi:MAG: histidine phosphatase family protein [Lachnospiraceae bacterium]|nr:histidine phosphatase family protein [Lachnospiraceae bacterium]